MQINKQKFILLILFLVVFLLCYIFLNKDSQLLIKQEYEVIKKTQAPQMSQSPTTRLTNIERSDEGCNLTDNFYWDQDLQVCIKDDLASLKESILPIQAVREYFSDQTILNIESISKRECQDCFFVKVEIDGQRILVDVTNGLGRSSRPVF